MFYLLLFSSSYCFKIIFQLRNHTSLNNAVSNVLFEFGTGNLRDHTIVIILVTQHTFLLETVYQCHIKQSRQRFAVSPAMVSAFVFNILP